MSRLFCFFLITFSCIVLSCEKQEVNDDDMVGTWGMKGDFIDVGDFVKIESNTIEFYSNGVYLDNGVYKFEYEHPHIYIGGMILFDVVSKSSNKMIWEDTEDKDQIELTRWMQPSGKSWIGAWNVNSYVTIPPLSSIIEERWNITEKEITVKGINTGLDYEGKYVFVNSTTIKIFDALFREGDYEIVNMSNSAMTWKRIYDSDSNTSCLMEFTKIQ